MEAVGDDWSVLAQCRADDTSRVRPLFLFLISARPNKAPSPLTDRSSAPGHGSRRCTSRKQYQPFDERPVLTEKLGEHVVLVRVSVAEHRILQ
jgi:hypothetical protein